MMKQMTREQELAEKLLNSRYLDEYINSIMERKKKESIKILVNYLVIKNSIGEHPCPAKVFDIIYINMFNVKKELRKISMLDLNIKVKSGKKDNLNIHNYIFYILDALKDEIKSEENYFWGVGTIDFEEFQNILNEQNIIPESNKKLDYIQRKKILNRNRTFSIKESFLKKKITTMYYQGIDKDELGAPPSYLLEVDEDELERIKKRIVDISLREGKFKTYNNLKGSKVENVSPTRDIEDFGDFLSSSLVTVKRNKTLFLKQLLEREILKIEKPLKVQSKKRFKIDFYLENTSKAQKKIRIDKLDEDKKIIYFSKILSILYLMDFSYIFSSIEHWNLDITYNYIPIMKNSNLNENFYVVDVKKIMSSLKKFVDVDDFSDLYGLERRNFNKFIINTINHGRDITQNIEGLKDKQLQYIEDRDGNNKGLKELSIIFILGDNKSEIESKKYDLEKCKELKNRYIFALNIEKEVILFNGKEYKLKNSYSNLRVDFLNELIAFFGGKS